MKFDALPANPYIDILLDPQKDEEEKALGIRALLDALPEDAVADYLDFRTALHGQKAVLEQRLGDIHNTPYENINDLLVNGADITSPVRAPALRQSFNDYFKTAEQVLAAYGQLQEDARRMERMFLVLATAEAGAARDSIVALSSSSVTMGGTYNSFNFDVYEEVRNFNEGLADIGTTANEVVAKRITLDRNIYQGSVAGYLAQGQGSEVSAPPKASFAARKKNPSAFTA